ncbi:TonB-dependent receptor [Sphingopyxis sp. R3-92]|uniref:TonB-dependent receptor n=1 Tax=Sphingopyxis sp. R3-92 TaxID=3158553 RepID=UPI003EE7E858
MKNILTALLGSTLLTSAAFAQDAGAPTDMGADSGEIIVTAQKREQSLKDVPLSVAVLSGEQLGDRNITEISQLQTTTPNFSFQGSNNPRGAGISIRGIGTNNFSSAIEGSVGIVIDGVPIGRQGAGMTDLFDIQRVEVLRGPQGTLFGKNASAGVLNIVTTDPSYDWGGRVQASYGEDNEFVLRGAVTGGLTENLAFRASAYMTKRDGYIKNVFDGSKLNDRDEWGGRAKLLWEPADNIRVVVAGDYTSRDAACCMWTLRNFGTNTNVKNAATAAGIVPGPNNRKVALDGDTFVRQETYGGSVQVDIEGTGGVTVTSITGLRWWDAVDNNDSDQRPLPVLNINNGDSRQRQFTQELRLASPSKQRIEWVLGMFLFNQDYDLGNSQQGTFDQPVPPGVQLSRAISVQNQTQNMAAFADATWHLNDQINVFGGLRYTVERLNTHFTRFGLPGTTRLGPLVDTKMKRVDGAWTWRLGAQVRPTEDITLYGTVARGFKGGGFNALQDSTVLRTVEPEIPTSYEIGAKTVLFDRRVRLNIALFSTDFEDFQAQAVGTSDTGAIVFDVINAGSLRTRGVEADIDIDLHNGLSLRGGAAYTDAKYTDFARAPCYAVQNLALGCITAGGQRSQDLTGKPLAMAPKFTGNATVRYETEVSAAGSTVFGQLSYSYRGRTFTALDLDPQSVQKGYGLLDAQLGFALPGDRMRAWIWGKNLADKSFVEMIYDTPLDSEGQSQFFPSTAARQFGVTVEYRF